MNTNIVEGSYVMIKKFMEEGGDVFNNKHYNKVLCDYHNYLVSNFLKETTILQRLVSAYWFLKYAENNKLILKKMSKDDIYKYISSFSEMNWDISYIDRNKFNFRKFLNWAYENKYTNLSGNMIIPNMKWHNRTSVKSFYSKEELIKLFNAIDIKTNKGKEDYLIICLICYLGLRISDIINLKISNFDFEKNSISIIQYKTGNKLFLPLIDQVKYPLIDYLKNVRPTDTELDYLFLTNSIPYKLKINLKKSSCMVGDYLKKAGVELQGRKHGFHSLRFSFSSMLFKENVDLYSISSILGHRDIKTTLLYIDVDTTKLKELALEVPIC